MNTNKKGRSPYRGIGPSPFVLHAYCITIFIKIPGLASSSQRDNRKEGEEAREREKDLENRVNFLRRGVSHSPLIGGGGFGASYFLIKSVYQNGKFFYPFQSSHSRVSKHSISLSLPATPDGGKFVRGVGSKLSLSLFLSICFLELSTVINRSVLQRVWQRKFIA